MGSKFISLLYPTEQSRSAHADGIGLPDISDDVCIELGLEEIFDLKCGRLADFFTTDEDVIRYRQQTLEDMVEIPEIGKALAEVTPILEDINELRRLDIETNSSGESYLYSITEIELYVSCIDTLSRGLSPVRDRIKSEAFSALADFAIELAESEYYTELNKKLEALAARVHEVRSITVGVNLDNQLRPSSAGVISINSEQFKSGKVLDKILRLSFKNDAFTCIAELSPFGKGQSENRQEALVGAFNSAIEEVFRSSVRGWRAVVGEYVLDSTDFLLRLLPEIEFVTKSSELMNKLAAHPGCTVTRPIICPKEERAFRAVGIYNPRVALAIDDEIVTNDFLFDDKAHI